MDSVLSVVSMAISYLLGIPAIGKYLALGLSVVVALGAVVTAVVGAWHGIVILLQALASIPGLSGLAGVAASMKVDEGKITDFSNSKILPIINRLSAIPIPKQK